MLQKGPALIMYMGENDILKQAIDFYFYVKIISGMSDKHIYLVINSEHAFATTESTHGREPYV